jgi:hypothetical protein
MNKLGVLVAAVIAAGLGIACSGRSAFSPEVDAACTAEQRNSVRLEGTERVTDLFITREYTVTDIRNNQSVNTTDYRVCQAYTCRVLRPDPAAPLSDAETAEALTACRTLADRSWDQRSL